MTILLLLALQDDTVANAEYAAWARFKPGAWVRYERTTTSGRTRAIEEIRHELVDVSAARVLIETRTRVLSSEEAREQPLERREIPARIRRPRDVRTLEGEEEIRFGGRLQKCRWVEESRESRGGRTVTRSWFRDDVPGGLVRRNVASDGEPPSHSVTAAVDWKIPDR